MMSKLQYPLALAVERGPAGLQDRGGDDGGLEGGDPIMQIGELGCALVDRDARADEHVERLIAL